MSAAATKPRSNNVTIIRAPKEKETPYFSCLRKNPQNKKLSLAARGLLWYLLSKPANWKVSIPDLMQGISEEATYKLIKELTDAGHITRHRGRGERGRFGKIVYLVYEEPRPVSPDVVAPDVVAPDVVAPRPVNPDVLKIREINKAEKETNKRKNTKQRKDPSPTTTPVQEDHSPDEQPDAAASAANGGGGEKSELTPIEMLLSENGVNAHSWKFAEGWTLEQVQVITDRSKEPGINRPAAWIVSQLQMPSARVMAQVELDTRHNQPADELTGQEATGVTSSAIPEFEPIVDGWKKDTPAPETWQHGVLNNLQAQLHAATFNSWLRDSRLLAYEGKQQPPVLTVVAPTQNAKEWLEQRLIEVVRKIAKQSFGTIALQIIAPSEIEPTLAAIKVRVEGIPPAPRQLIPGDIFTPGSGWIQRRDGDEQHEEKSDPVPAPAQPKGEDSKRSDQPDPASLSPAVIWSKIKSGLRHTDLNRDQFETYFKTAELIGYLGDEIFVKVGGHTVREVRTNLKSKVAGRIEKVTGGCWRIRLVDRDEADRLPENLIKLQEAV